MNLLYSAFLFSALLPYVQIIPIDSYTQPYAVALGLLIVMRRWNSIFRITPAADLFALTGLAISGIVMVLISSFPEVGAQELKYLLTYISPFIITCAALVIADDDIQLVRRALKAAIATWLSVAMVQSLIDPSFLSFLVGSWSETAENSVASGRGVIALAPEPTHHGFHMLLLAGAAALVGLRRPWVLVSIASAVLLARSSSAVLAIAIGLLLWTFVKPYRLAFTIPAALAVAASGLAVALALFGADSRLTTLASAFLEEPTNILLVDASVNMRLGGLIGSFDYMIDNWFAPNGVDHEHWLAVGQEIVRANSWLIAISESGPPSGLGVVLFQLGFVAFPMLGFIAYRFMSVDLDAWGSFAVLAAFSVFLGQYFISAPGFGLLYGLTIWRSCQGRVAVLSRPQSDPNASSLQPAAPA
jgi:hypothetical protein